jgi:hypothetical protein
VETLLKQPRGGAKGRIPSGMSSCEPRLLGRSRYRGTDAMSLREEIARCGRVQPSIATRGTCPFVDVPEYPEDGVRRAAGRPSAAGLPLA